MWWSWLVCVVLSSPWQLFNGSYCVCLWRHRIKTLRLSEKMMGLTVGLIIKNRTNSQYRFPFSNFSGLICASFGPTDTDSMLRESQKPSVSTTLNLERLLYPQFKLSSSALCTLCWCRCQPIWGKRLLKQTQGQLATRRILHRTSQLRHLLSTRFRVRLIFYHLRSCVKDGQTCCDEITTWCTLTQVTACTFFCSGTCEFQSAYNNWLSSNIMSTIDPFLAEIELKHILSAPERCATSGSEAWLFRLYWWLMCQEVHNFSASMHCALDHTDHWSGN